jgi:hypothetical protein
MLDRSRIGVWLTLVAICLACDVGDSLQANGGIGGTGYTSGTITGFGSIFVNGIEWETDDAEIEVENILGSESELELGMVVRIEGDFSADGTRGIASRVSYDDDIEGPIASIRDIGGDGLIKEIDVLGWTVVVERGLTHFDDDDSTFTFESMAIDDVVEVSGLVGAGGDIIATFIERKEALVLGVTEVEIEGVVSGFSGGTSFLIGSVLVHFDTPCPATDLSDLPNGVQNGISVEVHGLLIAQDEICAEEIEQEEDDDGDVELVNLEGIVSEYNALDDFKVGVQPVDASQAEFEHGDPSQLADGITVEVQGPIVSGILVAEEISLRSADLRVEAAVASDEDVDASSATFTLLGIAIRVDAKTRFEDEMGEDQLFGLDAIQAGDFLAVRGLSDGATGILASLVKRQDEDELDVALRGLIEGFDRNAGTVTILGLTLATDADATDFEGEDDEDLTSIEFFDRLHVGDLVHVDDTHDGDATTIDLADEVEIERAAPVMSALLADRSSEAPEAPAAEGNESGAQNPAEMIRAVQVFFTTVTDRTLEVLEEQSTQE